MDGFRNRVASGKSRQPIVMSKSKATKCPTCGSRRIRHVREDVTIHAGGISFVTPDVEFEDCPNCGEQIFDLAAMEKINAHKPSIARVKARKRKIA